MIIRAYQVSLAEQQLTDYAREYDLMQSELHNPLLGESGGKEALSEKVARLTELLIDSDREKRELRRQLNTCQQQLNHAKSALQALALENSEYRNSFGSIVVKREVVTDTSAL